MEQNDLKQIREEFGSVIEDNLMPVLNDIRTDVDDLKTRTTRIESQMVTKSYLDDKMADLEGATVARQRKEDQKVNLLIGMLKEKGTLEAKEAERLEEIKVFPV